MKIVFNIDSSAKSSIPEFITQVSSFKCRLQVDLKSTTVVASDMEPSELEHLIDAVNHCFKITGVSINTIDMATEKMEYMVDTTSTKIQSPKKIEYQNADIEKQMNKLLQIIHWMIEHKKVPSSEIIKHLLTVGSEIAMRFNPKPSPKVSVGDIVSCQYGTHLNGEFSGVHVHALVCDILDNSAFLIPMKPEILKGQFYLPFACTKDVVYTGPEKYLEGSLLLKKGNYVAIERIDQILGSALPQYFDKVRKVLPKAYCFEGMNSSNASNQEESTEFATIEDALEKFLGNKIGSLDENSTLESKVDHFLETINFPNEPLIKQAFLASCKVKTIKYESILSELQNANSELSTNRIKTILKDAFTNWIYMNYPNISKQFSNISIIPLLKFFSKNYK